jgi:glycosyltransferase involved in cell wall biosynthesis
MLPRHKRKRPVIAFFDYHDVFEDFYPHYGVTQREFATTWSNTGNHAFLSLIQRHIGDVIWYAFSLKPELNHAFHEQVGCQVRFIRSSTTHRLLWQLFYDSKHSWRWQQYYRTYELLASYSSLLSLPFARALRQDKPDCFFVQDYATGRFDVLCGLSKLFRVPLIARHAGSVPERYIGKVAKRWSLAHAQFIASSRRELERLETCYAIPKQRLHVVLTPVDVARFCSEARDEACRNAALPANRRYLLFLGRLDDRVKRVSAIIKAFAGIQHMHSDVDLLIAGDGPDYRALRELAQSLTPDRTRMLGWIASVEQRVHLYNLAEFLILPSRSEGFPAVVGEALACGTPVVASDVGGISELVIENKTGWLLKPGDDKQLLEKTASLLADHGIIESLRSTAREAALRRVSPEAVVGGLAKCFRSVTRRYEPH